MSIGKRKRRWGKHEDKRNWKECNKQLKQKGYGMRWVASEYIFCC